MKVTAALKAQLSITLIQLVFGQVSDAIALAQTLDALSTQLKTEAAANQKSG